VLARLAGLKGWVDGVCVTGGEPTLHEGLAELLGVFRGEGLLVKLDTNGSRPAVVAALLAAGLVDAVALDVKAPLEPVPYRRNAGQGSDADAVAETLGLLAAWGGWVDVRTTIHPDLLALDELLRLAGQTGRALARNPQARFTSQRCQNDDPLDPGLRDRPPLTPEEFAAWASEARREFARARPPGFGPRYLR
jgi:pyruvate formate lyase activating enzyme